MNDYEIENEFRLITQSLTKLMTALVQRREKPAHKDVATYRYLGRRVEACLNELDKADQRIKFKKIEFSLND